MADDVVQLARRFEPILYLHKEERFFPADAKRFLEQCALYRADAPFDTTSAWQGPLIAKEKIAAIKSETRPGDSYLGQANGAIHPFLTDTNTEERFLDLAGWRYNPGGGAVVSQIVPNVVNDEWNHLAHRDEVDRLYNDPATSIPALRDSQFWYHAELLDSVRLRTLMVVQAPQGFPNLAEIFTRLRNPALLCYYFFFPAHEERLDCGNVEFGSFVGEWACMTILLERDDPNVAYLPTWIGVSGRRNLGTRQGFDSRERRVAMTARRWQYKVDVHAHELPETIGDHPKIFVASGTHGLYLEPGSHGIEPFTPDSHPQECGRFESPDAFKKYNESVPDNKQAPTNWLKLLAASALGGLTVPLAAAVGLGWAILEGNWGAGIGPGVGPIGGDQAAPDVTGGPGNLGKVIHPKSLTVAEPGAELVPWSADKVTIDQRKYDFIVERSAQVWWPNLDGGPGYRGRWGPRVSIDPFDRRAGMRFPEFWRMFFVAYAKEVAALGL